MSNLILLAPQAAIIQSPRGANAGNLSSWSPKEVWTDTPDATSPAEIYIDFGTVLEWDTVALVGCSQRAAAMTVTGGAGSYVGSTFLGGRPLMPADARLPGTAIYHRAEGPVAVRYIRLLIARDGSPLSIGRVVVGKAFRSTYSRDLGGGRRPIDTGRATALADGGFAIARGVVKRELNWTWSNLGEDELAALWSLVEGQGGTGPVLAVEDPAAATQFGQGPVYGVLTSLEAYRRGDPTRHRWALSLEEWA